MDFCCVYGDKSQQSGALKILYERENERGSTNERKRRGGDNVSTARAKSKRAHAHTRDT